jgi:hypothetical protein
VDDRRLLMSRRAMIAYSLRSKNEFDAQMLAVFDPCPSSADELNLHKRGGGGLGSLYRLLRK